MTRCHSAPILPPDDVSLSAAVQIFFIKLLVSLINITVANRSWMTNVGGIMHSFAHTEAESYRG